MSFPRLVSLSAALFLLAGCSSADVFADRGYATRNSEIDKPKRAGTDGVVRICYTSETKLAERDRLASEACAPWGLIAVLVRDQPWQCRLLVPHLATYACVDPTMRYEDGSYADPFHQGQVDEWRRYHPPPGG